MKTCKFCGYQWDWDQPCEYSTDPETHETTYCGNQECPMCFACQGNEATPDLIRVNKQNREMRERGNWLPRRP